jgi:hypothetical protein
MAHVVRAQRRQASRHDGLSSSSVVRRRPGDRAQARAVVESVGPRCCLAAARAFVAVLLADTGWTYGDTTNVFVAVGTIGLAGLTAVLAWKTRDMAKATERMVSVTQDAINAEDRRLERTFTRHEDVQRRQLSFDAAIAMLDGIESSGIEPGSHDTNFIVERGALLRHRLWSRVNLLQDAQVKTRVQVCMAMLQFLRWYPENLARDGITLDEVAMLLPEIVQMTELTLQAYLAETDPPNADHHPAAADNLTVMAWIDDRQGRPGGTHAPGGPADS